MGLHMTISHSQAAEKVHCHFQGGFITDETVWKSNLAPVTLLAVHMNEFYQMRRDQSRLRWSNGNLLLVGTPLQSRQPA